MDKVKQFLSSHFEKIALFVALVFALTALIGLLRGGNIQVLRDSIDESKEEIESNMARAGIEPEFDPEELLSYDEAALAPFKYSPEPKLLPKIRLQGRRIVVLDSIRLELPPDKAFEKVFETGVPSAVVRVTIDDDDIGAVEIVDEKHFKITRSANMEEGGSTKIHFHTKSEEHFVRRLDIEIRIVYLPDPPEDVIGYAKPGRNFVIWRTPKKDLDTVIGFNVYRKELEDEEFDLESPLNGEFVEPLAEVPEEGDDEPGAIPIEGEEEEEEKGEDGEPGAEGEDDESDEDEEDAEKEEDAEPAPAKKRPFSLPGMEVFPPGAGRSTFSLSGNKGGMFVDRDVTPGVTYWYAVQTVANRPAEELARDRSEEPDRHSRSFLSETVTVQGADVTKIVFRSLVGRLDDEEAKKEARAVIEVRRFVKVAWVSGTFNVRIGGKIGGEIWVKKYPNVDPDTDEVTYKRKIIDFTTRYTLEDIIPIIKKESYTETTYRPDPKTGRMIITKEEKFRDVKSYKIIVRHDDGHTEEYSIEKPKKKKKRKPGPRPTPKPRPQKKPKKGKGGPPGFPPGMPPGMMPPGR